VYCARRRVKWPGAAAVVVSVVHVCKGQYAGARLLDEREVPTITAFLFHRGGHDDPARLGANEDKSFQGSIVLGMGFTFDDTDVKGVATPLAEMRRLLAENPANAEAVFPYIGGDEVNTSPTHAHHRYVINFADYPLKRADTGASWASATSAHQTSWLRQGIVPLDYQGPVAADWPDLLALVEQKVKPERTRRAPSGKYVLREPLPTRWWQYADKRPALYTAIAGLERVLVISRVGNAFAICQAMGRAVPSERLVVFPISTMSALAALQARVHETWARFFSSTFKDDLMYAPSDCFETFPFPEEWESRPDLETVGEAYYEFRADLMVRNNEGLTKTYNRFHDPEEDSHDIITLRELHAAMDRAVLDAYGWTDVPTDCEFLLDYEVDEEESSRKKKPWRYRWPDDVRDEVLARLLELNAQRAAKEALAGASGAKARKAKGRQAASPETETLF